MTKLIVLSNEETHEYELAAFNTIGRHPDNTIQILDRIVSKEHAQIERTPEKRYLLRDLRSLNGTFMEGKRVSEHYLNDGDEITMGSARLVFVDEKCEEKAQHRVTVSLEPSANPIRSRIIGSGDQFLNETSITDEAVLRRDYERLRISQELARFIGSELNLGKLLPKILEKAFELVGADRGAILLKDDTEEMVAHYVKTRTGEDDNIVLSKTVISEVVNNKAAVLSSDTMTDSRFSAAHSIVMHGIRSTMTVPLLYADEILGVMHLDSQIADTAFTAKDLQICTGMAAQAAIAIQNARLADRIEQEAETRAQLSRLVSPRVVEQVVKGELFIEKGGHAQTITMLYSDIRGFTAMSDRCPAKEVVTTLNEYFEIMVEILFKHQGTLDKFVGDAIIGLFGAPIAIDDAPYRAVACALEMFHGLTEFNRTRAAEDLPPIQIGIGITTGTVITGYIGSTRALQYTAIGDAMNVASRLVDLAKPGEIIISQETYDTIPNRITAEALQPVKVKGKADAQRVRRVTGLR